MLVCSLPMKNRKRFPPGMIYTSTTHANLDHYVTDTDCQCHTKWQDLWLCFHNFQTLVLNFQSTLCQLVNIHPHTSIVCDTGRLALVAYYSVQTTSILLSNFQKSYKDCFCLWTVTVFIRFSIHFSVNRASSLDRSLRCSHDKHFSDVLTVFLSGNKCTVGE